MTLGAVEATGVELRPGVELNDGMRRFAADLRRAVPAEIPLVVTSGYRSATAQASAMLKKYAYAEDNGKSGAEELHDTYGDDSAVDLLLRVPRTVEAWSAEITRLVSSGHSFSRHMRWGAMDFSIRAMTSAQLDQVKAAVKALGGRYLHEANPPHLHVDVPAAYLSAGAAPPAPPAAPPSPAPGADARPTADEPTSWLPVLVPVALLAVGGWWFAPVLTPYVAAGARVAASSAARLWRLL